MERLFIDRYNCSEERLVTNEFIAFIDLGNIKQHLTPKSFTIATLRAVRLRELQLDCDSGGWNRSSPRPAANPISHGLVCGLWGGTMANFMSACIAGMLV